MSFSSGSGDYVAMMASVLAHAVTDGWTTSGGTWPINKGNVKGVDWNTFTITESDRTFFGGGNKIARYMRLSIGNTPSEATTNSGSSSTSATVPNMEYTISNYWIYSDPSLCNYIHVVYQFSNNVNGDCFGHFGFGELDKHGMTHTAVMYASASPKRGYAVDTSNAPQAGDWNGGPISSIAHGFTGLAVGNYSLKRNYNHLVYIIDPLVSPVPAGWPSPGILRDGTLIMDCISINDGSSSEANPNSRNQSYTYKWSSWPLFSTVQPYSGAVSMGPLPVWLLQNTGGSASVMMIGSFPNVRVCSMNSYDPNALVSYGAENWSLFPALRKTDDSIVGTTDAVSTGRFGYAHKKVI